MPPTRTPQLLLHSWSRGLRDMGRGPAYRGVCTTDLHEGPLSGKCILAHPGGPSLWMGLKDLDKGCSWGMPPAALNVGSK